jgi:radical SAM superfamily enzyme YgiQ (UPF0313 family)
MLTTKGIREFNVIIKNTAKVQILFGYCYPSTYRAGMTNLASHLFYSLMNNREDTSCERYFRYDTYSSAHSVESRRPLKTNHVIGFSLSYEEDILNVLHMLNAGEIPLLASDREERDPIVVMGGPVVSANPEPFVDFVDVFAMGEGDVVIHDILDAVKESESKEHALSLFADIRGLYVPIMEQSHVERLIIPDLNKTFHPINQIIPDVPEGDGLEPVFGKAFLAEITRGCGHSCKFCLVGHICRPRRVRTYEKIIEILASGLENTPVKKIALIGSSLGDMDRLEDVAQWILNQGYGFSVPSLRADSVSEDLVEMLIEGGQRTLTIAPETGSFSFRQEMGKGLTDEDIERAVKIAADLKMYSMKLYYIIGLPGETKQDVLDIAKLTEKLAMENNIRITASVNPFIPKAFTRFQREPQPSIEIVREKIRLIERNLKSVPRVTTESLDPRHARVQAALSIGDRELGVVIRNAFKHGGLAGWRRAEKETGMKFFSIANDRSRLQEQLPWDFIT